MAYDEAGPAQEPQEKQAMEVRKARAAGAKKPGWLARATERGRENVEKIRFRADWQTFGWGLLVLLILAFIARNWAPVRVSFFGWYFDAPRAIVFVGIFLLGMATTWLIEARAKRIAAAQAAAAEMMHIAEDEASAIAETEDLELDEDLSDAPAVNVREAGI